MSSDDPTHFETAQLIRRAIERTEAPLASIDCKDSGAVETYQRALRNLFAASTKRKQQWSVSDVDQLVHLIGSPWPQLSRNAATVFLSLMSVCHDQLCGYLDGCFDNTLSLDHQEQLMADCREALLNAAGGGNVNLIRAFRNRPAPPIPPTDILAWLDHDDVYFCALVVTPSLEIYVAKLTSEAELFNGAWMELSASKHVLLVGARLEDKVSAVHHELEHVLQSRVVQRHPL